MALILPLHFFDGIYRLIPPRTSYQTPLEQSRLATFLTANASLFDLIRWRRVSKAFKQAADNRIRNFKRIDVRCYDGLAQLQEDKRTKENFEWHPHASMFILQTGTSELGIAIDSKFKQGDVKALLHLLFTFRHNIEQLFVDSPIIELLVSQINRQQVALLLELLKCSRTPCKQGSGKSDDSSAIACAEKHDDLPCRPFFPKLKKLTVTSQSDQLEHLSRLASYAIGVDFLYETSNIDLLCLKICIGNSKWTQKPNIRLFRHVTRFRQWTEAGSLGEKYFQQFSGSSRPSRL